MTSHHRNLVLIWETPNVSRIWLTQVSRVEGGWYMPNWKIPKKERPCGPTGTRAGHAEQRTQVLFNSHARPWPHCKEMVSAAGWLTLLLCYQSLFPTVQSQQSRSALCFTSLLSTWNRGNQLFRQSEQRERARSLVLSQHPLLTRKGRAQRAGPPLPPPGLQNWSRTQWLAPLQPLWNHEMKAKTTSFSPLLCSQTYLWPPEGFRTYEKFK